ncbi:MAG: PDZ domain-containing protein [Planctomycetaceae bacterium]|nr:PDZ domain-containing protein [Planctomycetaceae bacterium]
MTLAFMATLWLALAVPQDKDKLREALKDTELKGTWIYDDLDAGIAEARKSGKPMLVVLRCVPCVTFKGFDKQVASREDAELAALMDRFVCVRIVQGYGLDLSFFQFDYDLNWAAVLMNADRTIYGRYGSKAGEKGNAARVTIEGLRKALEAALEAHRGYPGNAKDYAAKVGAAPSWKTPEAIPDMKTRPNAVPADGSRAKCIHCHMMREAEIWTLRNSGQPVPDPLLWAYPMPDVVGLSMDLKERATVKSVAAGSAAEKGGFKAGDSIRTLQGQPILSVADVQWVLHNAKVPCSLEADVDRGGAAVKVSLALEEGWRRKDDWTWRVQVWPIRHRLLGISPLETLEGQGMNLRIKAFPPDFVKDKNREAAKVFQKDDVIVGVDDRQDVATESQLLAYLMQKKAGSSAEFSILRAGKPQKVTLTIP